MTIDHDTRSSWGQLLSSESPTLSPPVIRAATVTTLYDLLSPNECQALIAAAEAAGFQPEDRPLDPLHRQPSPAVPVCDRVDVADPILLQRLLNRLTPWLPGNVNDEPMMGLDSSARIHKYVAPQRMKTMKDRLSARIEVAHRLTLLVHLNSECSGGGLMFPNGAAVTPLTGAAVWFAQETRAQSEPIFQGVHYVLRLDVLYGVKEAIAA